MIIANIKKKKLNIFSKMAIIVIASLVYAVLMIMIIDAKYYRIKSIDTKINANGFYFSSNYLKEANNGEIPEYIMYGWNGKTTKSFAFKIRNYENPLLYNNEDQDVKYTITYEINDKYKDLVDVELYKKDGDSYQIVGSSGYECILSGTENNFQTDDYKLSIVPKKDVTIAEDLSVVVRAKTINSSYSRDLSTKVTLQYTEYENFISDKGFKEVDVNDYALNYTICTANEADLLEMENTNVTTATKKLHLTWNYNLVTMNRFEKKLADMFQTKVIGEGEVTSENMADFENTIILDKDKGIAHLYFEALPFSQFNIFFYKKLGNSSEKWKDSNDSTKYIWDTDDESIVNVSVVK